MASADKSIFSEVNSKVMKVNKSDENHISDVVQEYIDASQANATKRAYASDLRHFLAYGGSVPCSPRRLAKYLAMSANDGSAVSTLERRIAAIHKVHVDHKQASPAHSEIVKQVMQGIRRTLGTKQRQVEPITKKDLLASLIAMECNQIPLKTARDQALLLLGFASAMRRSELVRIRVEHISRLGDGIQIELPVSKTDPEHRGRVVFIPCATGKYCPVKALFNWLKAASINEGYVFRSVNRHGRISDQGLSAQSVALIVKAAVAKTELNSKNISGHSLRAGYCTTAAEMGLPLWKIREQTGHKSNLTLLKYIRRASQQAVPSLL